MRARRARRPAPRWFKATPEQVCGEGTEYMLVLTVPRAHGPLRWVLEVMRSTAVVAALLPVVFFIVIVLCALAWVGVDSVTTHLVVSAR